MKWDCTRTKQNRYLKWNLKQTKPKRYFAWLPEKMDSGICVWLESYYKIGKEYRVGFSSWYPANYQDRECYFKSFKRPWIYKTLTKEEYQNDYASK